MNKTIPTTVAVLLLFALPAPAHAQNIQVGDVLIVVAPNLTEVVDSNAYRAFVADEVAPAWNDSLPGTELHLVQSDRGRRSGDYLLLWTTSRSVRASVPAPNDALPFDAELFRATGLVPADGSDPADVIDGYTEYELVDAEPIGELPVVDVLGFHFLHVRPELEERFESFVRDTLYEALAGRTPGMELLYYRATRGIGAGSYLLLFAIETTGAREHYWPTGAPETEATKKAFEPLRPIARALSTYLVEGSYLEPDSGAAAAYIESLDWTDYVDVRALMP